MLQSYQEKHCQQITIELWKCIFKYIFKYRLLISINMKENTQFSLFAGKQQTMVQLFCFDYKLILQHLT